MDRGIKQSTSSFGTLVTTAPRLSSPLKNSSACSSRGDEAHFNSGNNMSSEPPYVGCYFFDGPLAVQQSPDSEPLGDAPRLGVAAALLMRNVAIDYLGNLAEAAFRYEPIHA